MNEQKQIGQLHAVVIQNLPELAPDQRQTLISNPAMVQKFLLGLLELLKLVFKLQSAIDRDMTGWKCLEPVDAGEGEFELVLEEFLKPADNGFLGGEEMVKRGREQGANSGLRHLEAILRQQDKIPVEMRQFYLVSTEVWQAPSDLSRDVWSLYWSGKSWVLNYDWLSYTFDSSCRFVRPRKYQKQS